MKVLISGSNGTLAKELVKHNKKNNKLILMPHEIMPVELYHTVYHIVQQERPDIFLHCGAMTHPMKDHYINPKKSIQSNIIGTANVAIVCTELNIKPVYISTDYVYKGNIPPSYSYSETDGANPADNYGWSKLGGECSINMIKNHLILRCCFSPRPFRHKKAFVDLYKSYMYVDRIAPIIWRLINNNCTGTYNIGGPKMNVYEFASKDNPDIGCIYRKEVDENIPFNTSMDISKLKEEINND